MPITTTITAGSSATIALAAGSSLALSGYGTAQVVPPAPQGVDPGLRQLVPTETRIGPFLAAVSVNVVATAAVSYYLAGATDVAASSGAQALSQVQQTVSVSAYSGTWAGKPSASSAGIGAIITITDVGAGGGYSQWRSDGATWRPVNGSLVLAQSAAPVILPSSGSSNASGVITMTTALQSTLANGQVCAIYLPAGVVTAGSQGTGAGVYQATGLGTNNTVQISGTGIVTANGAYAQTTGADITLATVTIPASAMGANGALRVRAVWGYSNSANNKILKEKFGGTAFKAATVTTTTQQPLLDTINNRGSAARQVANDQFSNSATATGNGVTTLSIDTSADVALTFAPQLANVADQITLEGYTVEILAG